MRISTSIVITQDGADIALTDLNYTRGFFFAFTNRYRCIIPESLRFTTGNANKEGLSLQGNVTVKLSNVGNILHTILNRHKYLRGRQATITVWDETDPELPFDTKPKLYEFQMRVDKFIIAGRGGTLTFVSPVAHLLTRTLNEDPDEITLPVWSTTTTTTTTGGSFTGAADGYYNSTHSPEIIYYQRGVAITRGVLGTQRFTAPSMTWRRVMVYGDTADRQGFLTTGRNVLTSILADAGFTDVDVTGINAVENASNVLSPILYDPVEVGDLLKDCMITLGGILYWSLLDNQVKVEVPGTLQVTPINIRERSIDATITPIVTVTDKQYTRSTVRSRREMVSEDDDFLNIATVIDAEAESNTQYDQTLHYEYDSLVLEEAGTRGQNAGRNLATRTVLRYRDPARTIQFKTNVNTLSQGSYVSVHHPSLVDLQGNVWQVMKVDGSAGEPVVTVIAEASGSAGNDIPETPGQATTNVTLTYGVDMQTINLADEIEANTTIRDASLIARAADGSRIPNAVLNVTIAGAVTIFSDDNRDPAILIDSRLSNVETINLRFTNGSDTRIAAAAGRGSSSGAHRSGIINGGDCIHFARSRSSQTVNIINPRAEFIIGGGAGEGIFFRGGSSSRGGFTSFQQLWSGGVGAGWYRGSTSDSFRTGTTLGPNLSTGGGGRSGETGFPADVSGPSIYGGYTPVALLAGTGGVLIRDI